ncbi:MAG: ribonuclease Z [Thermoleophilia bacterium]
MDLDVVFLGTAGSVPTAQRAPASVLLRRGGDRLLMDCGEGTQRQLLRSSVGLVELDDVLLTHFHLDHVLGLPGMLKTFALRGRELPLTVHGPRGLRDLFGALRPLLGRLPYPLTLVELEPGEAIERAGWRVEAFAVEHRSVALGYALVEEARPGRFDLDAARSLGVPEGPLWGALQRGESVTTPTGDVVEPSQVLGEARAGRRVVVTGDTRPTRSVLEASIGADVLIHEATFSEEERERAIETAHSTAAEAAEMARLAGVDLLALTHVSSRYFGSELAREARAVFPETVVPRDFDVIEVPFPERGRPTLHRGAASGRPAGSQDPPAPADGAAG